MIPVRIDFFPRLTAAERRLLKLKDRVADLRPLMQLQIAPALNRMLRRHWDTKGAAFGHQWAPWAPSTLAARIHKGNVEKGLLRDTDHLFEVIFRERATDDRLKMVGGVLRLQLNVKVPYAIYHQVGTSFMPDRQVFPDPLPKSFKTEVLNITRAYLQV